MLIKFVLLFWFCSVASAAIFDWKIFFAKRGEKETLADYSEVKRENITLKGREIYYLTNNIIFKEDFGPNARLTHIIVSDQGIIIGNNSACDNSFNAKYMQPMTVGHSDYRTMDTCPLKAQIYSLSKVDDVMQLNGTTDLHSGIHHIDVTFYLEDGSNVGGFRGLFNCIK